MNCTTCGATLKPGVRFCHKCGAPAGAAPASSTSTPAWQAGLPWGIAGLAIGALIVVLALRGGSGRSPGAEQASPPFAGGGAPAMDLSQMSPEEQARRLFDRVMRLQSQGKTDSMNFFMPMAVGAYLNLPELDLDGRFDLGLLRLASEDATGALSQADSIRRRVPTHLYAFVLRARAYELQGKPDLARQAYRDFLKNDQAERAKQRPEYQNHANLLDEFRAEASTKTAGS